MEKKDSRNFEKNSTISLAIVIIGSGLGGIFQILSGRIINDVSLYADLYSLFSLQTILVLPTTVITYVITKYIAEFFLKKQKAEMKSFLLTLIKPLSILVIIVYIAGLCGEKYISNLLHINNSVLIKLTIAYSAVSFLLPLVNGTLQGMQLFLAYGMISILGQLFKLIGIFVAGFSDHKLECIMCFLLLGTIISLIYGFIVVRKKLDGTSSVPVKIKWNELAEYAITAIWANIALTLLTNVDMIVIKHYFNEESGYYSVALVLGRLVYYFASAIAVVLFPMTVAAGHKSKESFQLLFKSIFYNAVLSFGAIVLLNIGGSYIVKICYGDLYDAAIDYILPITCMIFPMNIITLIINFLLAQNVGKFIVGVTIVGVLAEIICVVASPYNLLETVWLMALIIWVTLGIECVLLWQLERRTAQNG